MLGFARGCLANLLSPPAASRLFVACLQGLQARLAHLQSRRRSEN